MNPIQVALRVDMNDTVLISTFLDQFKLDDRENCNSCCALIWQQFFSTSRTNQEAFIQINLFLLYLKTFWASWPLSQILCWILLDNCGFLKISDLPIPGFFKNYAKLNTFSTYNGIYTEEAFGGPSFNVSFAIQWLVASNLFD